MDLPVGNKDGSGDPVARDIGHQRFERGEQIGAVGFWVGLDEPQIQAFVLV